ncbi:MAG TPA: MCP four helix bundle domain-containing protein, partial [Pseudomonas sp.]|uniref:MCP four helix bundle domain-containing protein n=1 Tax=Pseudomonas sp. TaxID=306 RepID=UPI002D15D1D4
MMGKTLRFDIGSKLIVAFAALIIGFGSLIFMTLERFVSLQESEERQFQGHYGWISDAKELRINIEAQRSELLLAISAGAVDGLDKHEEQIRQSKLQNDRLMQRMRASVVDDPKASDLLEQLTALRAAVHETRADQLQMIRSNQLQEALQLSTGVQMERLERVHELGLQLTTLTEQRIAEAQQRSRQALGALRERMFNLSLILVVGGALLAW